MNPTHVLRANTLASAMLAAACVFAPAIAAAEDWHTVASNSFTALAVDRESISDAEGIPYTIGAWFRFRFATSVDCAPPRGCYAASQRSYYQLNCYSGHVRLVERRFLDLNDNVLRRDDFVPWYYVPSDRSLEWQGLAYACAHYRSLFPGGWQLSPYPQ